MNNTTYAENQNESHLKEESYFDIKQTNNALLTNLNKKN